MKIEYIGHACLLIDTGKMKIATDPWFHGPAYCGQWRIFPKPVNAAALNHIDVIALSHGHEDHLHVPSLEQIRGNKTVFYPYLWYGGTKEYLQSLGFSKVTEAIPYKSYRVDGETTITYSTNSLDSIIVIENKGEVLVNVNDALHSSTAGAINHFIETIRGRWPRIDYLFCGYGGASYFPNCFHVPGKDDLAVGRLREQFFAHNFCGIVSRLRPKIAAPFAADFALLSPAQRWINDVRFPRPLMRQYYERNFGRGAGGGEVEITDMYPGDALDGLQLNAASPYRAVMNDGSLGHLIDEQYAEEISALKNPAWLAERQVEELRARILKNVSERAVIFGATPRGRLDRIVFSVRVNDVAERNCFNVAFRGDQASVERSAEPVSESLLVIDTNSRIMNYSFDNEWGGEALGIGYGCEVRIADRETVRAELDRACIQLLHRLPVFKSHMLRSPLRAMRVLMAEKAMRRRAVGAVYRSGAESPETIYGKQWLLESADRIRETCQLPLFDVETASRERAGAASPNNK
jgi:hypothetical protein